MGRSRGVIRVSEIQEDKVKTVTFSREVKTSEDSWVPKRGKNFFSVSFRHIGKIIDILIKLARKFGWKASALEKPEEQIRHLKRQLDDTINQRNELQQTATKLENEIENYKKSLDDLRRQVIKNNVDSFKRDITDFETLLLEVENKSKKEEDILIFLKEKRWFFGAEYHNVEPKKPVGSKSVLDFYLEDYKGQGTIVELKLPSDPIFADGESYGFSSKAAMALGQLIRYVEATIAVSHSRKMSQIERIGEIRPVGYLVIGRTKSKEEIDRLKIINSYLHFVQILSYDLMLLRAKSFIEWLG